MSFPDDGGPAFPSSPTVGAGGLLIRPADIGCEGLTICDYFAAKAMQYFLAEEHMCDQQDIAKAAYSMADAMLKARGEV